MGSIAAKLGFGCGGGEAKLGGGEGEAMKVAAAGSFGVASRRVGVRERSKEGGGDQARPPRKEKKKVLPRTRSPALAWTHSTAF